MLCLCPALSSLHTHPTGILPAEEDFATDLAGWGLLPGALNGRLAVWEAEEAASLAVWPSEFAEAAAEAAVDPAGGAREAAPLQAAAAAAALDAGLVPPGVAGAPPRGGGVGSRGGVGTGQWAKMAAAAADSVRLGHGQLLAASGAAAALTNALVGQWQAHTSWRASRVALAGALSLQRCGLDLLALPGLAGGPGDGVGGVLPQVAGSGGRGGYSGYGGGGPLVSGGWQPLDACGVPVGAPSNGRFPDAPAFGSAAAAGSKLLLLGGADRTSAGGGAGAQPRKAAGSSAAAAAAGGGCRSSSNRVPVCGWDLVQAVGGAAHPVAACLKGRTGPKALQDLSSLVLEVSVSSTAAGARVSVGGSRELRAAVCLHFQVGKQGFTGACLSLQQLAAAADAAPCPVLPLPSLSLPPPSLPLPALSPLHSTANL